MGRHCELCPVLADDAPIPEGCSDADGLSAVVSSSAIGVVLSLPALFGERHYRYSEAGGSGDEEREAVLGPSDFVHSPLDASLGDGSFCRDLDSPLRSLPILGGANRAVARVARRSSRSDGLRRPLLGIRFACKA